MKTFTMTIERDDALIDEIAWFARLSEDGNEVATFQGPSAHDVLIAVAIEVDHRSASQVPA